jgi:uncharacterized Tic20 family protein/DNA-binding Xre family transcriptional regulator
MNQPDLGIKVSELRQQKGFTQEQLAEKCEVSTRTIQRIESGEVDPRAFTLNRLGEVLEFDFEEPNVANENTWLVILNLSSVIVMFIIPLLIWSWKKNVSTKIAQQGRQVLNFQITMTLVLFAAAFLLMLVPAVLILMGEARVNAVEGTAIFQLLLVCMPLPLILIGIFCTYQGVINAVRALSDKPIHYPLSIEFVK